MPIKVQAGGQTPSPWGLTIAAIFVGFVLVLAGLATRFTTITWQEADFVMCIGFGIILAAFGTRASAKARGYTVTGAGAVSAILYGLLIKTVNPNDYVRLNIRNPLGNAKFKDVVVSDASCSTSDKGNTYRCYLKREDTRLDKIRNIQLRTEQLSGIKDWVFVSTANTDNEDWWNRLNDMVYAYADDDLYLNIDKKEITGRYGRAIFKSMEQDAALTYSQPPSAARKDVGPAPPIAPQAPLPAPSQLPSSPAPPSGPKPALPADRGETTVGKPALDPIKLVAQLSQGEDVVRKDARESLLALDKLAVPALIQKIRNNPRDTEIISDNIQVIGIIAAKGDLDIRRLDSVVTKADLELLAKLSANENQVVRYNAVLILSKIKDKRVLDSALGSLDENVSDNPNGAYNAVLIVSFIFDQLTDKQQDDTLDHLIEIVPKDRASSLALIEKMKAKL